MPDKAELNCTRTFDSVAFLVYHWDGKCTVKKENYYFWLLVLTAIAKILESGDIAKKQVQCSNKQAIRWYKL